MTVCKLYTVLMNLFYFTHGTYLAVKIDYLFLSAAAVGGVFCTAFLFTLCFVCIHILKCAKIGWKQRRQNPPDGNPKSTQNEKAPAPPQEPVYYIVEKKRTHPKTKYTEPKEIRFK